MNPREEIKDLAPKLFEWKHSEGYKVPVDYFDNLYVSVMRHTQ